MKLILLGAPGAGKGTQAEKICEKLSIPTISTGNIIREAIRNETEVGKKAKAIVEAGKLLDDATVVAIVEERIKADDCKNGFIFDGFPRTIPQAEALDKMGVDIDKVVNIEVTDEEIMERLTNRRVCPKCGIAEFESNKNIITCKKCGCTVEYLQTTQLKGINNDFVFSYVNDWYDYQEQYVHNLDLSQFNDKPCFTDTVALSEVALYKNKTLINENTTLMCYSNRFVVNDKVLNFSDITVTSVLGRNKLNIYYLDQVLQIKGETRFNAVKYVNIFYHWKNLQQGNDIDGEFLGL